MHKFLFFAFVLSAVYPDWPRDAVAGSQKIIADFQSRTFLPGIELTD